MKKLNTLGMGLFTFFAICFLFLGSADLFAQPTVKAIKRYSPTDQYTYEEYLTWEVEFSDPIDSKTISGDDFKMTQLDGYYYTAIDYVYQSDKDGYKWVVETYTYNYDGYGEIRLDFTGVVSNTKGTSTSKGYTFTSGETFIYGEKPTPEVSFFSRVSPTSQNIYAQDVAWNVYFNQAIDANTLTTSDFALNKSGTANGTISSITTVNSSTFRVNVNNVSGLGNLRLDFTGSVSNAAGDKSQYTYTYGPVFTIQPPISITSITRFTPLAQQFKGTSVTYRVIFNRSLLASSVNTTDFQLAALSGQISGSVTSVTGSGTTYYVTVSGISKDVELRLNANGSFTDTYSLTNSTTFFTGETYIIDITAPVIQYATITSSNQNIRRAIPENTVTVNFNTNEIINIVSAKINGKTVSHKGSGTTGGSSEYTYTLFDTEGLATFEFIVSDMAGNTTTFNKTTDGSFVNFVIPIPEVVIIEQPNDVIACEGSTDRFLFVVAAPDLKGYNIVYRWWKDGRKISNWTPDFGQLNFDTLRYKMSGTYRAEMFVFNPRWKSDYGNPFNYDSAKVSPVVFSEEINLYVLQRPSFLSDIKPITAALGSNLSLTFDAQIYGEHNMENPTYWTEIQWYRGNTPLTDNERYQGTKSSILNINNVDASDYATDYRVRLVGECETIWSNEFAISQEPYATIKVQPTSVEGCVNDVVQISVEAESTLQGMPLTYQWMVNGVAIIDEAGKFNGANSPDLNVTLTTALAYDGTEVFTCKVWPVGFPNNGATSSPAMITWKTAPVITMDLSNAYSAKVDDKVELYITVTGNNLTYTWTKDGVDLVNNNDSLVIDMVTLGDAGDYVVTVSNDCGDVTSTTATLAVTQGPIITSVNAITGLGLSQNYPNPFSSNSTMTFNSQRSGNATVVMTDMLGNIVANLYNGHVNAGVETPIQLNNMNLNSGTYFITLRMGDKVETRQVSVVR